MSFVHSPKIITEGLVLALDAGNTKSYTSGSTTWYDKSGNANNGTLTNGPTFSSANGGSIVFDGTNDYVDFGTSFSNVTTQLTINCWGKISGTPVDGIFITKGEFTGTQSSNFGFQIRSSTALRLYVSPSASAYVTIDSSNNLWDNNINNYTVTFNSGTVIFYKNGNPFSSGSLGVSSLPPSTGPLYVGFLKGYSAYYPGNIYTTQIYNRALSASEIQQNFNALRGRYGI
jgi:hypothetical protein